MLSELPGRGPSPERGGHTARRWLGALALAAAAAGCDAAPTPPEERGPANETARAIEALGFRSDGWTEWGDYVAVEGDILLRKSQLGPVQRSAPDPMVPRFQYRTPELVGSPLVHGLRVDLSGLASVPAWQDAARAAMADWSAVTGSYVGMSEGPQAHIRVTAECHATDLTFLARAEFPSGGMPGRVITVNACPGRDITREHKKHVMLHELGHTIGFRHTNWARRGETEPAHITGTPGTEGEDASVMNQADDDHVLSHYDRVAVRTLYPLPPPTVTVIRDGSFPRVSWNYPADATGQYSVRRLHNRYERYGRLPPETLNEEWLLASGSGATTLLDSGRTWTGTSSCSTMTTNYTRKESWLYEVVIHYPNGAALATGSAPIGTC